MMIKNIFKVTMVLSLPLLLAACAGNGGNPRDPLEPMNRAIYKFNDKADTYVMKPVATGYQKVTPQPVRNSVRNFFNNLNDVSSVVNYSLQAKPLPAFYSFSRVLLNSTAGVAGLFDVTGEKQRRYPAVGFSDTFAYWGWKNSSYLVLPLFGPSTVRDGTGALTGMVFRNAVLYGNPHNDRVLLAGSIEAVSAREELLGVEDTIKGAALDPYTYTRDGWLQMRAKSTGDDPVHSKEDDINLDELMQ